MTQNRPAPVRTLEVITTHLNADFDAMASMVAAKKLYPEALLVFRAADQSMATPERRAGMKPSDSAGHSLQPSTAKTANAIAVSATMAFVAER